MSGIKFIKNKENTCLINIDKIVEVGIWVDGEPYEITETLEGEDMDITVDFVIEGIDCNICDSRYKTIREAKNRIEEIQKEIKELNKENQ